MWDNQLRANQKAAVALGDSVHRLYDNQEQLLRDCDTIEAYQVSQIADLPFARFTSDIYHCHLH